MVSVSQAVRERRSRRAFLDRPIGEDVMRDIVDTARYSPSSGNVQPWMLHVLAGSDLLQLKEAVAITLSQQPRGEGMGYPIYPEDLKPAYQARRSQCAEDLYRTLGVHRQDKTGRARQFARNFTFFDAPVGMILSIDRTLGAAQWADLGIFIQTLLLLAHERGLATCAQACWTLVHQTVERQLDIPSERMIFCGIAIGYPDLTHPINSLETERASCDEIAEFRGFA